jgi:hypothetical protein
MIIFIEMRKEEGRIGAIDACKITNKQGKIKC